MLAGSSISSKITKSEWMSLDETLDREVLFLLQGPEYAGENFKAIVQSLVSSKASMSKCKGLLSAL